MLLQLALEALFVGLQSSQICCSIAKQGWVWTKQHGSLGGILSAFSSAKNTLYRGLYKGVNCRQLPANMSVLCCLMRCPPACGLSAANVIIVHCHRQRVRHK